MQAAAILELRKRKISTELAGLADAGQSLSERLLTTADGFAIDTATPAQRAACRILDGVPLGDLRNHPDVARLVGNEEAVALLPNEQGAMPTEAVFLAAIRSGKTNIAVCAGLRMALTADLSRMAPGDVPRVSIVSLKLDLSTEAYGKAIESIVGSPSLGPLLIDHRAGILTVRNRTGRPVQLAIVAGAKAGSGLVSRWSAGVIFDEAPRMSGSEDGVVNLDHARDAVIGRLLPGAQALYIGSPWAPFGPVYQMVQKHWRRPSHEMVVMRGTGPMLNPVHWTPERCEKLRETNPTAYQTDVCGEFADPEAGMFSPVAIDKNTRPRPLELPYNSALRYWAAVDPSEGSPTGNAWTLVIVEQVGEFFRVALAREFRGARPREIWRQIAECCAIYKLKWCATDQYAAASNEDLAAEFKLMLDVQAVSGPSKLKDFTDLQTLIHSDRIELSPNPTLKADLLAVRRRITQSGAAVVFPHTGDGRHCDYAPALCAAVTMGMAASDGLGAGGGGDGGTGYGIEVGGYGDGDGGGYGDGEVGGYLG